MGISWYQCMWMFCVQVISFCEKARLFDDCLYNFISRRTRSAKKEEREAEQIKRLFCIDIIEI